MQINGNLYGPFPIHSGVRQGCPLSVALYTLALHPLLTDLEHHLPAVHIGRSSRLVSVVAYADDVSLSHIDLRYLSGGGRHTTVLEGIWGATKLAKIKGPHHWKVVRP